MEIGKNQKNILESIMNESSSRASTALSQLTNKKVSIKLMETKLMKISELDVVVSSQAPTVCTFFEVLGDAPGFFLVLNSELTALLLVKAASGGETTDLSKLGKDTLGELGNIVAGSYISVLSDQSNLNMIASAPTVISGNISQTVEKLITSLDPNAKEILTVKSGLALGEKIYTQELLLVLKDRSFGILMDSLLKGK